MTEYGYSSDFLVGPAQPCPWCGQTLDAVGQAQSPTCAVPEPGDATVCILCVQVSIFERGGRLRRAAPHEIDDVARQVQADIRHMQHVWQQR